MQVYVGRPAPSLSFTGNQLSNAPQVLIGVVADGHNHNQACFGSTHQTR